MDTFINNTITALSQAINAAANADWWLEHSNCRADIDEFNKNLERARKWMESAREYLDKYETNVKTNGYDKDNH